MNSDKLAIDAVESSYLQFKEDEGAKLDSKAKHGALQKNSISNTAKPRENNSK